MTTSTSTCGLSAGANPRNDEMYLWSLLGSVCEVAVFPPMESPQFWHFYQFPLTPLSPADSASFPKFLLCRYSHAFHRRTFLLYFRPHPARLRQNVVSRAFPINNRRYRCDKLDGGNLKRLPKRDCRKFHRSNIFRLMHDCSRLPPEDQYSFWITARTV